MTQQEERRHQDAQLTDIARQLATLIERLDNTILALNAHVTVDNDREVRIRYLEGYISKLDGKIVGYSTAVGMFIYWGNALLKAKGLL